LIADGDEMEDINVDELREELPERQPRFVILNYRWEHNDGRVSYPLCMLFSTPQDCKMELQVKKIEHLKNAFRFFSQIKFYKNI